MNIQTITSNRLKSKFNLFVVAGCLIFLIGCANATSAQTPAAFEKEKENYRIGPGDVIDVIVSNNATLSRSGVRVTNNGTIQLALLDNDIAAACRTEKELAEQIKEKYKKYLLKPHVIVAVKEFNSTPVTLIGEVNSPTRFQLQRPTRLLEVITLGNGPSPKSGTVVQIIRDPNIATCQPKDSTESAAQLINFTLAETLKGGEQSNPFIQAGDVVRVLEAEEVKKVQAYITGNVKAPMTIDLKDPVTLTQAVAMAGGASPGAQIDKVRITRQVPGSLDTTSVSINLKEVSKNNKGDILLQPNDIVEIPGPKKNLFKDVLKTVLTGVARFPVPIP